MPRYIVEEETLVAIADAVRTKTRSTDKMYLSAMPDAIMSVFSSMIAESTTFSKNSTTVTESSELDNGELSTTTINFDDAGVPLSVVSDTRTLTIEMEYDDNGHPSTMIINGGERIINWEGFEDFGSLDEDTMLYNDTSLPNIESVWSSRKKDFPFAAIEDVRAQVEFVGSGSPYRLVLSRERLQLHSNSINMWSGIMFVNESGKAKFNYSAVAFGLSEDGKSWTDEYTIYEAANADQPHNYYPNLLWWSHDILKADGSPHLAASPDPVPASEDLTAQQSFMMGYGIGVTGGEVPVDIKDGEANG